MTFVPFYFDSNMWFGVVKDAETWRHLVSTYEHGDWGGCLSLDDILEAKMAPVLEIDELPRNYHMGAMEVRSGEMRSFGFRREHIPGTVTLEAWAKNRGMDLRKLAEGGAKA